MHRRLIVTLLVWLFAGPSAAAAVDPFAILRTAYAARDPVAAASAYSPDAILADRTAGAATSAIQGSRAIVGSFRQTFAQLGNMGPLDLNFRISSRDGAKVSGFYRLRSKGGATGYGRFEVVLAGDGRFASDTMFDAARSDFEELEGPVLMAPSDETLDAAYYGAFAGRYRLPSGCELVVTQSIVRLFVRDTCTQQWRGLSRVSGRDWTAGDRVLPDSVTQRYRFAPVQSARSAWLEVGSGLRATRSEHYGRESVTFLASDGVRLAGTVYIPNSRGHRQAATVLVHGSGPQDRNGYASIMAVLADELASRGRAVLVYDKRGTGESAGDGDRASFGRLADDAIAGMALLADRAHVDPTRIGLAGSSQAGWVAAEAIRRGARPADVFLLGAAGAALTVAEQNLYNTEVRMRCAKIDAADITLALEQQTAFFAFLKDSKRAADLDRLTQRARGRPGLADWLFPDSRSTDRSAGDWYTTLDPAFDPLPVWRGYRGRSLFLFSQHDDSTPTETALSRLKGSRVQTGRLTGAQHLGLAATDRCNAELSSLSAFSPDLFNRLAKF